MLPVVAGHTLLTIAAVGGAGVIQTIGVVTTLATVEVTLASALQLQRVYIVIAVVLL
jgi:hypothetical protein